MRYDDSTKDDSAGPPCPFKRKDPQKKGGPMLPCAGTLDTVVNRGGTHIGWFCPLCRTAFGVDDARLKKEETSR